ncbi:M56 family metallopeptidase [Xanthomarina gelatinilytica]|uniref:M56 family metallopeptidase n=1 Tax=Xanthomarina gelatinilytica TaxID=1137281 RepID=UPI003AA90CF4
MIEYIIKSSASLAVFMLFYKLFLENQNMHVFKRFYLLTTFLISFGIPFITFTQFVEVPVLINETIINNTTSSPLIHTDDSVNYLSYILWTIYFIGVLLFTVKFIYNLNSILIIIKQNPKFKTKKSINVLLEELIVPHTFLSYIFLNKTHFETHQIPKEVLIHEEVHVTQKHSLDILFIEICQILLWFNPLIYMLKKTMKLNHEFLADREVINQGITLSTYQQILLAFSSNALEPQLATAINYSSIKKRFTVMKTQTSKTGFWLRSIVLLPILAVLIYSFSTKEVVEKEMQQKANIELENIPVLEINKNPLQLKLNGKITTLESLETDFNSIVGNKKSSVKLKSNDVLTTEFIYKLQKHFGSNLKSLDVSIQDTKVIDKNSFMTKSGLQELLPTVNESVCDNCEIILTKKELINLRLATNSEKEITSFKFKIAGKPTIVIKGNRLNSTSIEYAQEAKNNDIFQVFDLKTSDGPLNKPFLIIVTDENIKNSKINTEEFKNIPPPPPPAAPAKQNKLPPPPPPPIPADATPEEKVKYQKTIDEYNKWYNTKVKKGEVSNIPPPPPPKSPLDFVIDMAKKDATFYYEGEKISSDKAISIIKENKSMNISSKNSTGKNPKVYLSKEPITIDD